MQDTAQSFSSGGFSYLPQSFWWIKHSLLTEGRFTHEPELDSIIGLKDPEMIPSTVISIKLDETIIKHAARQHLYLDRQEYELILGSFGISYSLGIHSRGTAHTTDLSAPVHAELYVFHSLDSMWLLATFGRIGQSIF